MTARKTLGLAASLAAITALAGCGGSSGPSKADFAKKADALCATTNKLHPPLPTPKTATAAAAQQAAEVQIRTQLDQQLKALKVPGSAKADFDAYNAGTQRIIATITTMKTDATSSNQRKYAADQQVFQQASVEREKSAVKLGFKTCGRSHPAK
jgi:hypothetical protein